MIGRNKIFGSAKKRIRAVLPQQFGKQSLSSATSSEPSSVGEQQDSEIKTTADSSDVSELRDLSRMRPWHRSLLHGQPPPIDTFKWQKERGALKERYATYGRASGVDPGVQWPTKEELDEMRQEDDELHPKLLPTMEEMKQLKAQRQEEEEARYAEVEKKAKQYPKILAAYRKKLQEQQAAIDEEKRLKEEKVKEIQSYFGFAIDVTDPRFSAMMAKKEVEEKQARKKAMKREREAEALRRIEEETKLLKQREQLQFQAAKKEDAQAKSS